MLTRCLCFLISSEVLAQAPVPNRALGVLSIASSPVGATVELVDPQARSSRGITPLTIPLAMVGRWKVKASKQGFGVEETTVEVLANETTNLVLPLRLAVALAVTGSPDDARVTVTGPNFHGDGGLPWMADGLTAGSYVVKVTREGAHAFEWSDRIAPGGFVHVVAKLAPMAPRSVPRKPKDCMPDEPVPSPAQVDQDTLDDKRASEQIETLKRVMARSDDNEGMAALLFQLAELHRQKACFAERRALASAGSREQADLREATLFTNAVISLYEHLRREYPRFERRDEVLFRLAQLLGKTRPAMARYSELIKDHPSSRFLPEAWVQLGDHFCEQRAFEKAHLAYERALLSSDPRLQAMVLARRGWCELSAGEPEPALKRFEEVVARCESSDEDVKGDALRGLTKASLSLGRVEEARAYLKKHAREPELTSLLKLLDEASRR